MPGISNYSCHSKSIAYFLLFWHPLRDATMRLQPFFLLFFLFFLFLPYPKSYPSFAKEVTKGDIRAKVRASVFENNGKRYSFNGALMTAKAVGAVERGLGANGSWNLGTEGVREKTKRCVVSFIKEMISKIASKTRRNGICIRKWERDLLPLMSKTARFWNLRRKMSQLERGWSRTPAGSNFLGRLENRFRFWYLRLTRVF